MQVEDLPLARQLTVECLLHQLLVVFADDRPDGTAPFGRSLDHGDVAQPGERHVEGARDRGRREREHVDLEPQLAQQLLLGDAEALLLVDDHEAEILRDHVARQDPVRADQDVDCSFRIASEHALDVGGLAKARHHLDLDGEVAVAIAERAPVLLREHGRRDQHQHLLA